VLVTGAHTSVGARIVRRILEEGGEVRAFGAGVEGSLRTAGAIVADADADDEGRLEAALEQVHTVIHPGLGLLDAPGIPAEVAAATLATAAENAAVQRVIPLSILSAGDTDRYREAKGRVERLLADTSVPTVVLRTGLVATEELLVRLRSLPSGAPERDVIHAPLHPEDLLDVLAALDNLRSTAQEGHVVFHAVGPEQAALGDWLDAQAGAAGGGGGPASRVGTVYRPVAAGSLLADALATDAWRPSPRDGLDVFEFLGLAARPTRAG
jgi:nucleoside-diphosphate-sugar epimerase